MRPSGSVSWRRKPVARTISIDSRNNRSASSSFPCAARTRPSASRVVELEDASPGPTVSSASSASRSASSRRCCPSRTWARIRWLSTSVPRSSSGLSNRIASRRRSSARPKITLRPGNEPQRVQRASELDRDAAFREQLTCLLERLLGFVETAFDRRLLAFDPQRQRSGRRASALCRELTRAGKRLAREVRLEPRVVDLGELEQHPALQVPAPDVLRDRELLGCESLDLGHVALPPADRSEQLQRVEAPDVVRRGRRPRAHRVASSRARSLSPSRCSDTCARTVSARPSIRRSPASCAASQHVSASRSRRSACRSSARPPGRRGSAARASARARPRERTGVAP